MLLFFDEGVDVIVGEATMFSRLPGPQKDASDTPVLDVIHQRFL